jgi:hypothetical protein
LRRWFKGGNDVETKHTPIPWHVHGEGYVPQPGAEKLYSIAWSNDGELVAEGVYGKENAAFIVRACNAHEELEAALNEALEVITAQLVHGEVSVEGWQETHDQIVDALSKAEAAA